MCWSIDFFGEYTYINSIFGLYLPTFRSQAAIVSEKSTVFAFSNRKVQVTNLTWPVKYVKVNPGL